MQVNLDAPERAAPFHHCRVEVRCEIAIAFRLPSPLIKAMVAGSSIEMQSHKTFPLGVQTTSARWPIANCGCVPMPITPGSYWRYELKCPAVRAASVVQVCPRGGTYCRSSSQITHCRGATLLGVYWVPQAVQMNASISLFREHALLCTLIIDRPRPASLGFTRRKMRNGVGSPKGCNQKGRDL